MMSRNIFYRFAKFWGRKFHNRLFLINALVFIIVVYIFAIYASVVVTQLEMSNYLQNSREVLLAVCNEYNRKHDDFSNVLLQLYNKDNYDTLTMLMKEGIDANQSNDPFFKQRVINMMQWLTLKDTDIIALFLHKNSDETDFVYYEKTQSFAPTSHGLTIFKQLREKKSYKRSIYGVNLWNTDKQTERIYGIVGNIGIGSLSHNTGVIMVAYDVMGLHRIFQQYSNTVTGQFLILSKSGEVIFDSTMELYGRKFNHMELVNSGNGTVSIDGVKSVVQVIDRHDRGYYGLYIEANDIIKLQLFNNKLLIFAIATGVSLFSAFLYLVAGFISTRRVTELERAMQNIGSNNLSYRISLRGKDDEFEHIASRFNMMCDDLQDKIIKLYINEIKQKNAELKALEAGLNPHFLYNTLDAIRSMVHEDGNDDAAEFIVCLSSFLRNLVRSQRFIPIRQELDFCKMYLNMFMLRYADSFNYEFDICPDILEYGVPKGILQPVLENYFVHGIQEGIDNNYMQVAARLKDNRIIFQISDNGKGIDIGRLNEIKNRLSSLDTSQKTYGLANVHERIILVYGKGYGLSLESTENKKTVVTVCIMAMKCEELEQSMNFIESNFESS